MCVLEVCIIYRQVKHIICLLWDFNGIVQAIGRNKDKQFEPAVDTFVLWYYADKGRMLDEINAIDSKKYKYQNWVLQQLGLPPKKDRTAYGIKKSLAALVAEGRVFVGNDGKQELARIIGLYDDRGRLLTTPEKLNPELQKLGIPYQIIKGKRLKGKQTYYVTKIGDVII